MTVNDLKKCLEKFPDDEDVNALYIKTGVVVFPVKNYDTVWFFDKFKLKQGKVMCVNFCKHKIDILTGYDDCFSFEVEYKRGKYDPTIDLEFSNSDIGYSVFLSEEEAKKAEAISEYTNVYCGRQRV